MKKHLLLLSLLSIVALCNAQTYYGTTYRGGADTTTGTIFSFNAYNNDESVAYSFGKKPDGTNPVGNLVYDSVNGLFYGTTILGGDSGMGAIIRFDPATGNDSVVYSFKGWPYEAGLPQASLIYNKGTGLFYGMTPEGGTNLYNNGGTIFSFDPSTNTEIMLWQFGNVAGDGNNPFGNLAYDPDNGLYYGTTQYGGNIDVQGITGGTIISFNTTTNKDSVVWSFGGNGDGIYPDGSLIYNAKNKLFYGLTLNNIVNDSDTENGGIIFSFNPANNAEHVLWTFGSGNDGATPYSSLTYDPSNGLFYALTYFGGTNNKGAIISFDTTGNVEAVVHSFTGNPDGEVPHGDLVYDAGNDLLYGTTTGGGINGIGSFGGTIFNFNPGNNIESVVWNFGGDTDGIEPYADLAIYPPTAGAGIQKLSVNNNQLSIYPNPTSGEFTIKSNGNQNGYTVQVYTMLGERIYESVNKSALGDLGVINFSSQPAGLYFVYLKSEEGVEVGKVLLTK